MFRRTFLASLLTLFVPTSISNKLWGKPENKDEFWIPLIPINPKNLPIVEFETKENFWFLTDKFESLLGDWKTTRTAKSSFGGKPIVGLGSRDEYRFVNVWMNKKDAVAGFDTEGQICVFWGEVHLRQSKWSYQWDSYTISSSFHPTKESHYIAMGHKDSHSTKNVKLPNTQIS
jgi:hypothetical protein